MEEYHERLKEAEEKKDKEAQIKLDNLEKEFPLEDRILAIEQMKAKERLDKELKELEETQVRFNPVLIKDIPTTTKYEWLWDGVIARGHGTLLSCLIKAGKSTFLRCFLRALYDEEEFIGLPTKKCNVLVITEESLSDWRMKAPEFGLDVEDYNLWIVKPAFYGKPSSKMWIAFITGDVFNFCILNKVDLVIVDTLSRFWSVDNENDASQTNAALSPFEKLKDNNMAVLIIQQGNKAGGLFGRSIRGSTEIGGWADEVIIFSRLDGDNQKSRRRQIDFYGRLYDSEDKIVIRLDHDNTYITEGPKYQFSKQVRKETLLEIFKKAVIPLTIKEIRDGWDESLYNNKPSDDTILRYIHEMVEDKVLRLVDEIFSTKRKTPRFGIFDKLYLEQLTANDQTPSVVHAVSYDKTQLTAGTGVGENISIEPTVDETKGISPGESEKFLKDTKPYYPADE